MGILEERYGFGGRFAAEAAQYPELFPARVISQSKSLYRVVCAGGELAAEVSGKYRYEAAGTLDFPAAGDFVLLDRESGASGNAVIHRLLTRGSVFVRRAAGTANAEQVVAANIDVVFICMSLNNDFNLRRLERYLSIGWDSGATPVVVLTKSDLCGELPARLREAESVCMGADILVTSALGEDGCAAVMRYISPGVTVALIGSSGVGKSTLINRLLGEDRLDTNGLRGDDKGRHTTTRRELIPLPCGGIVIDTPGMRELGIWDGGEGLERSFADIEALAARCRFHDCSHSGEPGCAVQEALDSGALPEERWLSYQKLRQEADYAEDTAAYLQHKEEKFKSISKLNKSNRKK